MGHTTITVKSEIKDLLSLLKGGKTWDEFLEEIADHYPKQAAIEVLQARLNDLRTGSVRGTQWPVVKAKSRRFKH
jgi:hypothetical protein